MVNDHHRFINNYSAVERGSFLPTIRAKQEPRREQNRSQRAYTWPHEQISTTCNWRRLNSWMHKWDSRSVCARRRFTVSAFDAVSVLLRLHSTNACVAFLLFCRVAVSLHLHSVPMRLHSVSFCSFPWCLRSKIIGICAILSQAPPFSYSRTEPFVLWTCSYCWRLSCVHRAFVLFSWICCLFFVDLSFVFRLSFKRSLAVRGNFNARFALAFALSENGKGTFQLRVLLLAVHRAAERRASALWRERRIYPSKCRHWGVYHGRQSGSVKHK